MTNYYECGDGWIPLIEEAKTIIAKYNKKLKNEHLAGEPLEFVQIKEKWGGLCLYLNYYVPEIADQIHELEGKSLDICEQCGTNKNVKRDWTHGWIMTLCDKCREEELERFNSRFKNTNSVNENSNNN